jgi:DNA-binding MarR family transcriptional regulator
VDTKWLDREQLAAWVRVVAVLELLPPALDSQLRHDAGLTHFQYMVLSTLSEAPQLTLRMTSLAARTHATPPRLSHVAQRLEDAGLVERFPCPEDARATNIRLTAAGRKKVQDSSPEHVANVRQHVIDALSPEQITQLTAITDAILHRLDPNETMSPTYRRYDPDPAEPQ